MATTRRGAQGLQALGKRFGALPSSSASSRSLATAAESVKSSPEFSDLEESSSIHATTPDQSSVDAFNEGVNRSRASKYKLPAARYQYHPPRYDRGPLHPIQSPRSSDPIARNFVPGPFNYPRFKETFEHTVVPDLVTLTYMHTPPGTPAPEPKDRLPYWDDSSPYHKNRPRRGPRGSSTLPLLEKPITWQNIPEIESIALHSFSRDNQERPFFHITKAAIQAVSGVVPEPIRIKTSVPDFKIKKGRLAGVKAVIEGDRAYEFLDKCLHFVLPKIKDWQGLKATSGDGSGNFAFGLIPAHVAYFPEIDVNYDMYPLKAIPGMDVTIRTTAKSDRHARLLLQALGFPFHGKFML